MSRNLLTRSIEQVGLDQRIWALLEVGGYGDASSSASPAAANSVGHTAASIEFSIPRENSAFRSSRSVVSRLSGKKEVKWSLETYIIPGAPDGSSHPTAPDVDPMLQTAFGTLTTSDPTKRIYSLARGNSKSFRMLEEGTHFSRLAVGCACDTVTFTLPGDGKAMVKFEGFGQDVYFAGEAALSAGVAAANDLILSTGQSGRFEVGGYIDILDKDDGITSKTTTARKITAINSGTDTLTVSGATITADLGDIVIGYAPAFTPQDATNALLGLRGSFSTTALGTVDAQLLKAEIIIKNNYTDKGQFYGTSKTQGYIADKRRSVSVKLEVMLTRDNIEFYTNNKTFVADGLVIVLQPQNIPAPMNAALGRTFTFTLPRVEFNVPKLDQPADGFLKLQLEGTALATDLNTTDTELTLQIS